MAEDELDLEALELAAEQPACHDAQGCIRIFAWELRELCSLARRLDWLDQNGLRLEHCDGADEAPEHWMIWLEDGDDPQGLGESLPEAIDDAMQADAEDPLPVAPHIRARPSTRSSSGRAARSRRGPQP